MSSYSSFESSSDSSSSSPQPVEWELIQIITKVKGHRTGKCRCVPMDKKIKKQSKQTVKKIDKFASQADCQKAKVRKCPKL